MESPDGPGPRGNRASRGERTDREQEEIIMSWQKSDITTRVKLMNKITIHEASADWSNWPKTITITVDGETTTHKTLRDAMHKLMATDPYYDDRKPETTTTENKEETTMTTKTETITYHGKQVPVYGGAWNDSMNSCFYDVIGSVKGYDICRSTTDETVFALSNPMAEDEKEEDTMETKIEFSKPQTFERAEGRTPVTLIRAERMTPTNNWHFVDDDYATWYRKPEWDNGEGCMAFYMPDSTRGQEIQMSVEAYEALITNTTNNEEEDTTMKTTITNTLVTIGNVTGFAINGIAYTTNIETGYCNKCTNGKTKRIGKAEYETAKAEYDQAVLDAQPSRVEIENDLDKPAVLNENGLVDCSKCNCDRCVHRNCMRRNPRNVGGLGECPRLDNGVVSEAQKMAEETGIEPAEAELAVNVQNEQKKARKARKSKDIAYEGNGVTLTAKQVDFLGHLSDTCFWENGAESTAWVDVLCDEIGGQFADKPMTVGAMVSTLCEKGLGYRGVEKMTDMATGRSHKSTYFGLTELGQKIYTELGLE